MLGAVVVEAGAGVEVGEVAGAEAGVGAVDPAITPGRVQAGVGEVAGNLPFRNILKSETRPP